MILDISITLALHTLHASQVVLAETSSDIGGAILLAGPIAAGVTFWLIYRYYRNVDKKHHFEHETRIVSQPVTGTDVKVGENRGTTKSKISGRNSQRPRERVRRMQ